MTAEAPQWMTGIRRRMDYGWRYRGAPTGLLSDNAIVLGGNSDESGQLMAAWGKGGFPAACLQCGTCTSLCPYEFAKDGGGFSPRRMVRETQLVYPPLEREESWLCATCRACEDKCPRGVKIADFMMALRGVEIGFALDTVPAGLRRALRNIASVGNPFGEPREKRVEWADRIRVKRFTRGMDLLYFPGCFAAYDARATRVAVALVSLLRMAGVDFGILGEDESCCGESVRKAGAEELYLTLARHNIARFRERGVTRILTTSPHCYHTFKTEYSSIGGDFEVLHHTEYLAQLVREGRLRLGASLRATVTYHDPCYLGRYHGVYNQPREVLRSIPGIEVVEMERSRGRSICCGGGGGRIWQGAVRGQRLSGFRFDQAGRTGCEYLAVSCPYCLSNFDIGQSPGGSSRTMEVKDIAELLWQAVCVSG